MKTKIMLTVGLILVLAVMYGYGQEPTILKVKIPYQFSIQGKVLPAGDYEIRYDPASDLFRIKGKGDASFEGRAMTYLAAEMHTTSENAHIVFDKVGETRMLSEIWFPGDVGYQLQLTKDKHGHDVINVMYAVGAEPLTERPVR